MKEMKTVILICYSLLLLTPHYADACPSDGPAFPEHYLNGGGEADILQMPEPYFAREVRRFFDLPPHRSEYRKRWDRQIYVWENKSPIPEEHPTTVEKDTNDLKIALEKSGNPKTNELLLSYAAMRREMAETDQEGNLLPFDIADYQSVLSQLPEEFSLYIYAAEEYRTQNYPRAFALWNQLLSLPPGQRQYRSVWAAYMIGMEWLRLEPAEPANAIIFFQQCRKLASQGYKDSIGLSIDSLGWEAKANLLANEPRKALRLYLQQGLSGKDQAMDFLSMSMACGEIYSKEGLSEELVRDPQLRPVITAAILSGNIGDSGGYHYYGDETDAKPQDVDRWMAIIKSTKVKLSAVEADDLAWLCYNKGQMEKAGKWLQMSQSHTTIGKWLQSKLLLRDGKVDEAISLLQRIGKEIPQGEIWSHNDDVGPNDDFQERVRSTHPGSYLIVLPHSEIWAQIGVLFLGKGQFVDSLDAFLKSDFWEDTSYLAERVVTPKELEDYLKSHKDLSALNYIYARRLARLKKWDQARIYFAKDFAKGKVLMLDSGTTQTTDLLGIYDQFVKHIRTAQNQQNKLHARAEAYYQAGLIARKWGMEIFGAELEPDFTINDGEYWWYPVSEIRLGERPREAGLYTTQSLPIPAYLTAGAEERRRVKESTCTPYERYHYRWYASDLMWKAAQLLPDNDPLLAEALIHGGIFIADRDVKGGDKFYKALVRRCCKLPVGQEADRLRDFPSRSPYD
jgi:tetratricopeptide (TPR) repeat protein